MRVDPTTLPFALTRLPLACFGKTSWDTPVMIAGYTKPVNTVKTSVKRNPGPSSLIMCFSSRQSKCDDDLVDDPNARERHDDSSQPVDEQIPAQHLSCADWFVLHAAQCKR